MKNFLCVGWIFLLGNCLSIQIGNPSFTVLQNKGQSGWYTPGKIPVPGDTYVESCTTNYFGLVSVGNASYEWLTKKSQLKEIHSVDHIFKNQYFFFQELCLRVTGI
ncbi:TRL-like family protein [Leptospira levettii]|uniref:TRL-like family protein n=1 Tax=Leptospira levettii TaxID=2023178 RepID=A0AAW5V6Z3_9LEPT|nr:TRL-like family protein [Leptospira levettii]MCW7465479.1 TRL-like family protein [Leptospira levettii]MCW7510218.1 TRL-like family protein [Leptospira levettii]MCW7513970.1 TRL-like family protein [Leptospira levettii]TGM29604.1 TRL-like family protein [Leptospira levettii]